MAKRKPYRFFLYLFARGMAALICLLPRKAAQRLAVRAGSLAYGLVGRQRDKTLRNLRIAFGDSKSEREIQTIARGVFRNFAQTAVETLQFSKLSAGKIRQIVDVGNAEQVLRDLLAEGRGIISMTAHLGNWELLAAATIAMGFEASVIARKIYYEPYNRWIIGLRGSMNVKTIYRDNASRDILKVLGRNEIIGMLPDQDVEGLKGIFVDFFGKPAYTSVAPARLAFQLQTPILTNFMVRCPEGGYKWVLGDVIRPERGPSREEAVCQVTVRWMRSFEKVIQQYPEQWSWMHERWKTKPDARRGVFAARGAEKAVKNV